MICFLTSSPYDEDQLHFIKKSSFVNDLKKYWKKCNVLYIASFPDAYDVTDSYSEKHKNIYDAAGFEFDSWNVLDHRNIDSAEELVKAAGVIILCGGHCLTEHKFYEEFGLKRLLKDYNGIIIGVSAGSMNSASKVYAPPEYEDELTDPDFIRWYDGLGLTDINIFPHYHIYKDALLGDKRIMEDIVYPDSFGHEFYCMPDGSYLLIENGEWKLCGEYVLVKDGQIAKVQGDF